MGNPYVLVVDDHSATVDLIRSALEILGMEVGTAGNGAEGIVAIHKRRPDVIILDVMMPVMDGFQTLQVLHESKEHRDIPIIMLTGRSDDVDIAYGWRWGVTSYLTKPFSVDHLVALVQRVLEGAAHVGADEADPV